MRWPYRRHLHLFLANAYGDLYAGAAGRLAKRIHERPKPKHLVYLCEGNHRFWALIETTAPRQGRVAWSNVLPSGAEVKSEKSWTYATMRTRPPSPSTVVSPRYLKILSLPPPPARSGRARQRPFVPLAKFRIAS